MSEEELTSEEQQQLEAYLSHNYPQQEEKAGIFHFFNKIFDAKDTIKASNLLQEELDAIRNLRRAELYCELHNFDKIQKYFRERAEIILGSALSREGFLIRMAITTKKETSAKLKTGEDKKSTWNKHKQQEWA